jgi:hypothetical protein
VIAETCVPPQPNFMTAIASVLSSTDARIFKRLANGDVVDVELVPESSSRENQRKATQQMKAAIEKAAAKSPPPPPPPLPPPQRGGSGEIASEEISGGNGSALRAAMLVAETRCTSDAEDQRPLVATSRHQDKTKDTAQPKKNSSPSSPPPFVPPAPPPSHSNPPLSFSSTSNLNLQRDLSLDEVDDGDHKRPVKRSRKDTDDNDERLEKQGLLIELRRMESRGVKLSRRFGEEDSIEELEFEVVRQNSAVSTDTAVSFAREMMRFGLVGIEMANKRLGPFLALDGWSDSVCQDMRRYDHALERLYKQYWRKHQVSPLLEIGSIIIGSMVMWHFQSSLFGPPAAASRQASPSATTRAPDPPFAAAASASNSSFPEARRRAVIEAPQRQQQKQQQKRTSPPPTLPEADENPQQSSSSTSGRRPDLRPPTALFGRASTN